MPTTPDVRQIPGFEGRYSVTADGRVWSHYGGCFLQPQKSGKNGAYHQVRLGGRSIQVHTLVLLAFVGRRPAGMQARHLDGNGHNNARGNLEWATPLVNTRDKYRHGTMHVGERSATAVLSDAEAERVKQRRAEGLSYPKLSAEFGISVSHAHRICTDQARRLHAPSGAQT